ncbi:hypothetical protein R1sor_014655 [Riccia sorocarpa]|uniref:Uncharacterized protein n=1 Tax=Riccia sorocarpa TaxID=122646 RepID=A0ABD3HE96_9MARC
MGGISKSTLDDAVSLKLRKKFDPDCKCSQKALISKDKRLEYAPSLRFPTVKVLGSPEKDGKALGSHLNLKLNVKRQHLMSLKGLKHLEITTAVDTNDTYKILFPGGVRKVRLESKNVKRMVSGAGRGSGSRKRLEELGLMSVTSLLLITPDDQFKTLKEVVLRDISGLENNLPKALFQMKSLQSLSIQYCEHVSLLPDFDMRSLEHLHLALPALIRLRSVQFLTLETFGCSDNYQLVLVRL